MGLAERVGLRLPVHKGKPASHAAAPHARPKTADVCAQKKRLLWALVRPCVFGVSIPAGEFAPAPESIAQGLRIRHPRRFLQLLQRRQSAVLFLDL